MPDKSRVTAKSQNNPSSKAIFFRSLLVGYGKFAAEELGREDDIRIPRAILPLRARFRELKESADDTEPAIEAFVMAPASGDLRVVLRQRDQDGNPVRSVSTRPMNEVFLIRASQSGRPLPVEIRYDHVIWSGLSWAMGEIPHRAFAPGRPIHLHLATTDPDPDLHLEGQVYRVEY